MGVCKAPQIIQAMVTVIGCHQNLVTRQRNQFGTGLEGFPLLYSLYGSERCHAGCSGKTVLNTVNRCGPCVQQFQPSRPGGPTCVEW